MRLGLLYKKKDFPESGDKDKEEKIFLRAISKEEKMAYPNIESLPYVFQKYFRISMSHCLL